MGRWLAVAVIGLGLVACGQWYKPKASSSASALMALPAQDASLASTGSAPVTTAAPASGQNWSVGGAAPGEGLREGDDACVQAALHSLVIHAKNDTLVVSGRLALGSCLAASLRGPNAEVLAADEELRFYMMIGCDGLDLNAWDGKTYGDLVATDGFPCAAAQGARVATETEDLQSARVSRMTPAGPVIAEEGRRVLRATVGADGGPCRFVQQDGHLARDRCADINRTTVTRSRLERNGQVLISPDEGKEDDQRVDDGPVGANLP